MENQGGDNSIEEDVSVDLGKLIDLDNEKNNRGLDGVFNKWQPFKRAIVGLAVSLFLGGLIIYYLLN